MSSAGGSSRSSRDLIRRRESDDDQPSADLSQPQSAAQASAGIGAATGATLAESAAAQVQSAGAQPWPLPDPKSARSPRHACHLNRLADVELQLTLQWLDTISKLMAARCSQRLLHAASAPFAWKDAPLLDVTVSQLAAAPIDSSLLRLIPISLLIYDLDRRSNVQHIVQLPVINLRELHLWDVDQQDNRPLSSLLQCQAVQSLQLLNAFETPIPPDTLRFVAQLPHLHSLSIQCQDGCDLDALVAAPALTRLAIFLCCSNQRRSMQSIGQCLQLRSLRLVNPPRSVRSGRDLFTMTPSPQQRIERLELERLLMLANPNWSDIPVPTAEEMIAGFTAMRHLTHLRLTHIFGIDALLACVHAVPALRVLELELEPQSANGMSFSGPTHPTVGAVRDLLDRAPQLEVRLLLAPSVNKWLAQSHPREIGRSKPVFVEQWHQLRRDFSGIPRLSIVGPPD